MYLGIVINIAHTIDIYFVIDSHMIIVVTILKKKKK